MARRAFFPPQTAPRAVCYDIESAVGWNRVRQSPTTAGSNGIVTNSQDLGEGEGKGLEPVISFSTITFILIKT